MADLDIPDLDMTDLDMADLPLPRATTCRSPVPPAPNPAYIPAHQ